MIVLSNSKNAQWYIDKYGVENINDLTNDQLMASYSDAKQTSWTGGIVTGTGTITVYSAAAFVTLEFAVKNTGIVFPVKIHPLQMNAYDQSIVHS